MRRAFVAGLLVLMAGCGSRSTDDWLKQLEDPDVVKRRQAIRELGARPADAARVVPALAGALGDESPYVRRDAAVALGKFGPDAREAAPALRRASKDRDPQVRAAAVAASKKIEPAGR
jgi:HEAT repeat protein